MRSFPASNISLYVALSCSGNAGFDPWGSGGFGGIGGLMLTAYQWMIEKCNAPNVGYNQNYRNEKTVNGITYYDCSSMIWYALLHAGFDLDKNAWPFTTDTMRKLLVDIGFQRYVIDDINTFKFQKGDILVVHNNSHQHTEMVYDTENGGHTMGAHTWKRPLEEQVSINTYTISQGTPYELCYRWPFSGGDWVSGGNSEYFGSPVKPLGGNNEKQINNATVIYNYFKAQGWTLEAICGLLGNVQQESTFNPNLIEIDGTGHGLVQWTPPTDLYKVLDVLYGNHNDWYDGNKQLSVILAEYQQKTGIKNWGIEPQWYVELAPSNYRMQWNEYVKSTADVGYLARVWEYCYERPAKAHPERAENAKAWYEYFKKGE